MGTNILTDTNLGQFITAHGWGDHASGGYQTTSGLNAAIDTHVNQSNPTSGHVLSWNGSDYAWVANTGGGIASVVADTSPQLGGTLDANSNTIDMGTNVLTDTNLGQFITAHGWGNHASASYLTSVPAQTFASLTSKPTTLSGYGITDAATTFASLTSKPTTISGYGITDAATEFGLPADQSFTVVNSGSGSYTIGGGASGSNAALTLIRGRTYKFAVNATGHPFYINTSNTTGTGAAYVNGTAVINNGAAVGDIYFTVPDTAPATLYYNCEYHSSMAGTINISEAFVIDKTNNRIESDGSILVSNSSLALARRQNPAGWSEVGISLGGDTAGLLNANVTGNHHRLGREEDGKIVAFFNAGNDIGNIGVESSDNLTIGGTTANHSGLLFGTNAIIPMQAGSGSDATQDLGNSGSRFKDLHLSSGVVFGDAGGTGTTSSSNTLNSYEVGTWTPTILNGWGVTSPTWSTNEGFYVKVGKVVHISFRMALSGGSVNGNALKLQGLPFTVAQVTNISGWFAAASSNAENVFLGIEANQAYPPFYYQSGTGTSVFTGSHAGAGFSLTFSGTFQTT
jgi:hypothetical protein